MKRFLAVLICVLFLTTAGSSEASSCKLTWNADAEGVQRWLINSGVSDDAASQLASPAADLMNALSCELKYRDLIPVFLSIQLQDQTMLSVSADVTDTGKYLLQSNLFTGIALQLDNPFRQLNDADVRSQLLEIISGWFSELNCTQEKGTFIGDAYTDGATRYTWCVTDAQLIDLVRSVSVSLGINLSDFDSLLACLEASNEGTLQIVAVTDSTDTLAGISVTLLNGDTTLVTLSVHPETDGFTSVLGYRFQQKLWYHTLRFTYVSRNELTAVIDSRCTTQAMDYAALKASSDPMNHLELSLSVTDDSNRLLLNASDTLNETSITYFDLTAGMDGLTAVISSGKEKTTAWTFRIQTAEDEASSFTSDEMTVLDLTSGNLTDKDADMLSSSLSGSLEQLGVSLLKNLPTSVLTLLFTFSY